MREKNCEYIKRSAVVSALISVENRYNRNRDHENASAEALYKDLCDAEIEIGKMHAEDVVPVVRCKDCKYYSLCGRPPFMFYQCTRQGVTMTVGENDFCNYGEK